MLHRTGALRDYTLVGAAEKSDAGEAIGAGENLRAGEKPGAGEELGSVEDLYFDDRYWTVRYLVVDTGGWLVQKRVLVSPRALLAVDRKTKTITTDLTRERLGHSPAPDDQAPVSRQFEIAYNEYYDYSPYWIGILAWGAYTAPRPPEDAAPLEERKSWDSSLYSAADLTGFTRYRVLAGDGEAGHVSDLIVSDTDWAVRYLVIDTRDWLPGKHVLLPPQWTAVDWESNTISVELSRETIKGAPEYHKDAPIDRTYEEELFGHYCRRAYWTDDALCYDPPTLREPEAERPGP